MNAANALLRQAVEHHQQGRLAEAENLYRQVLALAPSQPDAHNLLGVIAHQTGHLDAAIELMTRATSLNRKDLNFQLNLANALLAKGDATASAKRFRKALSLRPDHAAAQNGLGLALRSLGQRDESLKAFERATRLDPGHWEAVFNLGCAYEQGGELARAAECYERALVLQPRFMLALSNLGGVKSKLGRYADAEIDLRQALEIEPNAAIAHVNLGNALLAQARVDEAITCFRRAIEIAPTLAEAYNNFGRAWQEKKDYDESVRCCEQAVRLRPDYAEAMVNLGCAMREQGRTAEALTWFRRAIEIKPDYQVARSNAQFSMILLPGYDMAAICEANRAFWSHRAMAGDPAPKHSNSPEPQRRLRVGYVSGDFRRHAAAYFLEPILAHRARDNFEVFCYYNHSHQDETTRRFKVHADAWRQIQDLADVEVASTIRVDGIDILVDLSGHTANGRITVFAKKPSPVQVTYLGYPATSGLAAMDYRLTDAIADPPEAADPFYTEKLWRLPDSLVCYAPPADLPEVGALPAEIRGYVTFGSFNGVSKIGPEVVALWAKIMAEIPGSRLLITSIPVGFAQSRMADLFAASGIERSRLQMVAGLSNVEFLNLYGEVDVALDPFPCNGGTSTCEALWMGVPVVCLAGNTFAGRVAPSMLAAAGRPEWAARSESEYLETALRLAGDMENLAVTRRGLRDAVQESALGDAEKFTRGFEHALRSMWIQWCP